MIIFCTGMPRSASTWSFNVCLQLVSRAFPGSNIHAEYQEDFAGLIGRLDAGCEHLIVKSHKLDELGRKLLLLGAAKAVYTRRDPFDAIASVMVMFDRPFEVAFADIRDSFELYEFHSQSGNCCTIPYDSIVQDSMNAVRSVQVYLGLEIPPTEAEQVSADTGLDAMRQLSDRVGRDPSSAVCVGNLLYDRRTLLHRNHIRNGGIGYGRSILSEEQQQVVGEFLQARRQGPTSPHQPTSSLQKLPRI